AERVDVLGERGRLLVRAGLRGGTGRCRRRRRGSVVQMPGGDREQQHAAGRGRMERRCSRACRREALVRPCREGHAGHDQGRDGYGGSEAAGGKAMRRPKGIRRGGGLLRDRGGLHLGAGSGGRLRCLPGQARQRRERGAGNELLPGEWAARHFVWRRVEREQRPHAGIAASPGLAFPRLREAAPRSPSRGIGFIAVAGDGSLVLAQTRTTPQPGRRGVNPVLTHLRARLESLLADEEGQTMAEYAVVLAVITGATVAVFTALSGGISGAINNVIGII